MEADTKGFESNFQQSQKVAQTFLSTIKEESAKLAQELEKTTEHVGKIIPSDLSAKVEKTTSQLNSLGGELQNTGNKANHAGAEIGKAIPADMVSLAQNLSNKFFSAAKEIEGIGDKSVISAGELRSMTNIGEQGLSELNLALKAAQAELVRLQSTDGTLKDIEIAKQRVLSVEDAIKQTSNAFNYYKDVAVNAMSGVDNATIKTISEVQKFTSVDLTGVTAEAQSVTRAIEGMGAGAVVSTREVERIGKLGAVAVDTLGRELESARIAWKALADSSGDISLEELTAAKDRVVGLEHALDLTENSMSDFKAATQQASPVVDNFDQSLDKTNKELKNTESFSQKAANEIQGLKSGFSVLTGALAALGIGVSAAEIAKTADEFKNLSGRVNIAIGENGNLAKSMDDVKNVAIATNSNLTSTGDLYSRLTKIGQEMKWPQEQALALTETINKAIQVGGGSASTNEAAITQLNQALGSGVLRGDEFNSMVEQSPRLTQAMADGLGVTTGQLREMANQGQLTTEVVTRALLSQSEKISAEFAKFPTTIGASIENLKTSWTIYIGEADAASGASARVAEAIKFVAENLDTIVSALVLAGQAFIAYKALNIGLTFLEKANNVKAASLAIAQETTSVIANTQAQIANAGATKATAIAKGQLSTSTIAATASAGTSLMGLVGRLGTLGIAITSLGVMGVAVTGMLTPLGEWMGEAAAKAMGYGDAIEKLEKQQILETIQAKVAAEIKQSFAEAAEKARDKAYQLTEESKKLVAEFDELIKKGEPAKEALEKISNAMKFDSTKGINNSITALILLKDQGKITGDELQQSLGKALDGKDLVVFETNARSAFAGTKQEAVKTAEVTQAVMQAALERTGLSTEQLQGRFSLTFQSASNDVQMVVNNLDAYKAKGIDTGLALSANLNKAIDTAQTRAELDYAKSSLISLEKQGLITGQQVAIGLGLIEKKGAQLPAALNPTIAAFNALGIKTKEQLNDAAISAQKNFEVVSSSGQATAEAIKQAYITMLNAAIASGNKSQIALVQAKAASLGLEVQVDSTGKATVKAGDEMEASMHRVRNATDGAKQGFRELGQTARDEALSSTEAWNKAMQAKAGSARETVKGEKTRLSFTKEEVAQQLMDMGYDEKQAKTKAKDIIESSKSGDGYKNASGTWLAKNGLDVIGSFANGGGGSSNANYIREQLEQYSQYAGKSSVQTGNAPTQKIEITNGKQTANLNGSKQDVNNMEAMLREFEMLKKGM